MLIARVAGEVVATQKHQSNEGRKLLLVQPLNRMVRIVEMPSSPVDMAAIGFIDRVDLP